MVDRCLVVTLTLAAFACGKGQPKLTRETVLPLLQQEAQKLKAEGEKMPDVGMRVTWNVAGVEVQEQPGNQAEPFRGSVLFKIESTTTGSGQTQIIEKKFSYVYNTTLNRWSFNP